jgi:ribose 5-phosphate isomerase A
MADGLDRLKQQAAQRAVEAVESGMVLGLGSGSTAVYAVRRIAERIQRGELRNIVAVPTSTVTEHEARRTGIPLTTLEIHPVVDLTIDGADEIDPHLNAIKGGGGALLREKIVAQASLRMIVIVDETKPSPVLGTRWWLPVEVVTFGWGAQRLFLEDLGARVTLRTADSEQPFRTDHGNFILDCNFGQVADPHALARQLEGRAGIVEHGLFLDLITDMILATEAGIEHRQRPD